MKLAVDWCSVYDDPELAWRVYDVEWGPDGGVIDVELPPWIKFGRKIDAEIAAEALGNLSDQEYYNITDQDLRRLAYENLQW